MQKDRLTLDLEEISCALWKLEHQLTRAAVCKETVEDLARIRRLVTCVIGREVYGVDIDDP